MDRVLGIRHSFASLTRTIRPSRLLAALLLSVLANMLAFAAVLIVGMAWKYASGAPGSESVVHTGLFLIICFTTFYMVWLARRLRRGSIRSAISGARRPGMLFPAAVYAGLVTGAAGFWLWPAAFWIAGMAGSALAGSEPPSCYPQSICWWLA